MSRFGDESCSRAGEYEYPDFIVGSLRGLRSFNIDPKSGHLTGIFFPTRWSDGVNEAQCFQAKASMTPYPEVPSPSVMGFGPFSMMLKNVHGFTFTEGEPVLKPGYLPADCPGIARGDHGCGFYAWHGTTQPDSTRWIAGVVEMYGQVEMGPKGLRSSKARLLAMVHPMGWGSRRTFHHGALIEAAEKRAELEVIRGEKPERGTLEKREYFKLRMKWWEELVEQRKKVIEYATNKAAEIERQVQSFEETTRALYPSVPVFNSLPEMLNAFPVPSLDHLCTEDVE